MPYIEVSEFKGMDTRKPRVVGVPGTLFSLKNGHLTRGSYIQRSKSFVSKFALPTGSGTTDAQVSYRLDAGTTGSCSSILVGATELLGSPVAFNATLTQTATDIVTEINANTSGGLAHGYSATSTGQVITIIAPAGSGASENGKLLTFVCSGDLVHTGDAFWGNTVNLMNFNGPDGSTTVNLDTSVNGVGSPHLFTWNGNAQADTAQTQFGTSSLLLDGSGDTIFAPNSADVEFGAGEFTVEAWIRLSSFKTFQGIASSWSEWNNSRSWLFWYKGSTNQLFFDYSTDGVGRVNLGTPDLGLVLDTWYHVAALRDSSNNLRIYLDGVEKASSVAAVTFFDAFGTTPTRIGSWQTSAATGFFDGWIKSFRVTKGSSRYAGDFVVPIAEPDIANTTAGAVMGGLLAGSGTGSSATFGLHGQGGNLFVFGGFTEPAGVPSGVTYQRLAHPTNPGTTQILRILDAENFDGKIYAIAEFTDSEIHHYYDGARVTDWDDISAAIASNNSVASALKTKIDLSPDFAATVLTNVVTIEAAVAGVGFTIAATAQNFGTVNDQVITLAQTVANNAGAGEVLATGTLTVTGGTPNTASEGSVDLTGGASGSVDGITVNGVEIMSGAESFNTSLTVTATNVAANITANTSAPDYNAAAVGTLITITALASAGADPNTFVVVSSTTTITSADVDMGTVTTGVTNAITALTVDGVSLIDNRVNFAPEGSNSETATDLAAEINGTTSSPNYTAAAVAGVVTITAIAGTGAGPNGFVVARTVVGDLTAGVTNMQGGVTAAGTAKEKWDATITGTFEAPDVFTITLNGEDFVVTGAGSATGITAITFKKKMYVTASSLLYFSGINNATVWAQVPNTEVASQIGAGFVNFANQDSGSEALTATGIYQGNLGVFASGVTQIEFVDVDEEANTLLHTVSGTGTEAHRTVVQFGNTDLFYLDRELGVRSLRARDSSNAPSADDVGTPIDDHILAHLATVTEQQAVDAWGMIADDGRYWLAIKNRIYVFSFFKNSKVSAWSFYEPKFNITAMAKVAKKIYARDDADTIYLYGGDNGNTYPAALETPLEIEFPFMDVDKAAHDKTLEAFDFAAVNTFDCNILVNPNDETIMSETFELSDVTYPNNQVGGLTLQSSHFAPKLVCDKAGLAELHSVAVHYQLGVAP